MRKKHKVLVVLAVLFGLAGGSYMLEKHKGNAATDEHTGMSFYVSKDGIDTNDGSVKAPFATLEKARDAIRDMRSSSGLPVGGVTIRVRKGEYRFTGTFQLDGKDSGTAESPIVYKAYQSEKVTFTGGDILKPSLFKPVTDTNMLSRLPQETKDKVLQLDLKALGITNYGAIINNQNATSSSNQVPPAELFINDKAMNLARWPNDKFATVNTVIDKGDATANKGMTFTYTGDGLRKWSKLDDVWTFGYWGNDWATNDLKIKSIDFDKKQIETVSASNYPAINKQRFYIYNVLEELDAPGEWYLDRSSGMFYLYPPSSIKDSIAQLSLLDKTMIRFNGASYITFSGINMEVSRGNAVELKGDHNRISDCTISKMGGYAVKVLDGTDNGVERSHIYNMGSGGVYLNGGNITTLTPAGNFVENCEFQNYSRLVRTYTPAIQLDGVGNRASHNKIHDAPHFAIKFTGNDHVMEYNDIYDVVKETGDASAIYSGRSFVWRGNVIRYNFIHDLPDTGFRVATSGVYLDDFMSGVEIRGNIFYNLGREGLRIANGRENVIENNIIMETKLSINYNKRDYSSPTNAGRISLLNRFNTVPYKSEIWSKRYPTLPSMPGDDWMEPKGNIVRNNVLYKAGNMGGDDRNMKLGKFENNITLDAQTDLGFADAAHGNFELKDSSIIYTRLPGFEKIPFSQIGIIAAQDKNKKTER